MKLLGRVPLDGALRLSGDEGLPLVLSTPASDPARAIREIAAAIDAARGAGFTRTLPLVS